MDYIYYLRVIFAFLIIAGILFVVYKVTRKVQKVKFEGSMKVVDFLALDSDLGLFIVKVRNQEYLFSKGGKGLSYIKEV